MSTTAVREGRLEAAGATLYYRTQGKGPLLVVLQGGAGAAEGADAVVAALAERFTVLTYDRRGLSRSVVADPDATPGIAKHVDDVHRLLASMTQEPAAVVGFSMGALLGLELAARHPQQVRLLVSHEPPVPEVLPADDQARARAEQAGVEEAFKTEGPAGAIRRFVALTASDLADREAGTELPRPTGARAAQHVANMAFFMRHDAPAVHRHALSLDDLETVVREGTTRIVLAAGETDRHAWIHQCARNLAQRLGVRLVELPGGHSGFVTHPRAFAARLLEVLT